MDNFLIQNNKALANARIKSLRTEDSAVSSSHPVASISNPQRFLHYLAAKKLGFPVTFSGKSLNDSGSSDRGNNRKDGNQNRKNRFLSNNKKSGGMDYGDQIEI